MIKVLQKTYTCGTHRLLAPEQTLMNITRHLETLGVTRLADVTGLDSIGIPVYCAIRPSAKSLQVSNGKGLGQADAKVSALMEAIELHHFENPPSNLRRGSLRSLQREGHHVIEPDTLPCYRSDVFFSADRVIDWVSADELLSAKEVWLPASAAY